MKQCPVCKARCFDDMEICYGCLHRFEEEYPDDELDVEEADFPIESGVPFVSRHVNGGSIAVHVEIPLAALAP